jgi:hypothetical protein
MMLGFLFLVLLIGFGIWYYVNYSPLICFTN